MVGSLLYGILEVASKLSTGSWVPGSPVAISIGFVAGLFKGTSSAVWTPMHTHVAIGFGFILALVGLAVFVPWYLRQGATSSFDTRAKYLSDGSSMSRQAVAKKARLGRLAAKDAVPGVFIANTVSKARARYAGWRDGMLIFMGPGAGKTTSVGVPVILDAPGNVMFTTNKRDLPDAVLGPRKKVGQVSVFDPEGIGNYPNNDWWIDILEYITDAIPKGTADVRARTLAKVWMDAARPAKAASHGYFDTAGPNLISGLLLACALSGNPITQVFKWVTNVMNQTPVAIVRTAGFDLVAAALEGVYNDPDEQRAGVFGTASEILSFLNSQQVVRWITDDGTGRRKFSPKEFVRAKADTLGALSKEGIITTAPLTASLVKMVLDAAEELADQHAHGRLPVAMTVMLDEAANVCRIRELPSMFTHYGSRGIFLSVILQNRAQGAIAWGADGIEQMWGAATIRIVGAGLLDEPFLKQVSSLTGGRWARRYSQGSSSGRQSGSSSRNVSSEKEPVLDVDDLASMPAGRAVIFPAGNRPWAAALVPWYERPEMADEVRESISMYEPHQAKVSA